MYRIAFNPTTACWMVQLQVFGFFWQSIRNGKELGEVGFDNYAAASEYVKTVGLDKVYRDSRATPAAHIWGGADPARGY